VLSVDKRVSKVLDIKTPGSGEAEKNLWENLDHLQPNDEIKFVLCDEKDYQWARELLRVRNLAQRCAVLFSPVQGQLSPKELA
ncbi:MAG: 7-carboxy-7-deazaguanine synthase QueE, partial [Pseudomonadota bacterium]